MLNTEHLDRPIWSALTHDHAHMGQMLGLARRYRSEFSPFHAAETMSDAAVADLMSLIEPGETASLVELAPQDPPPGFSARHVEIVQLVATEFPDREGEFDVRSLSAEYADQMLELACLTKPGPFRERTGEFGRYLGIFDGGRLVAMGGERMAFDGFVEISAVCTHPDYRGRGYGAALICSVGRQLQADGKTPFLHSNADNAVALGLYQSLGLKPRRNLWHTMWEPVE